MDSTFGRIANLKRSYRATYRALKKAKEDANEHDKEIIAGMISDVLYAIEWMHTARQPGNKRGIERRAAYQREKLVDPFKLQTFFQHTPRYSDAPSTSVTDEQCKHIQQMLSELSKRERECFELHVGNGFSLGQVAAMLGIKKGTVQGHVDTARKKIKGGHTFAT